MTRDEAIAKARKLLQLAKSDNEHEARLAMARAQEILERFEIQLAAIEGTDSTEGEAYSETPVPLGRRNVTHWRRVLLGGLGRANGCSAFLWDNCLVLCGKPSDVQRAIGLYNECAAIVDRLALSRCQGMGRSFANSFRMGAALTIVKEAREAQLATREGMRAEGFSEKALVVVDTRAELAKATMESRHKFEKSTSMGNFRSGLGMRMGADAGKGVFSSAARPKVGGGAVGRLGNGA